MVSHNQFKMEDKPLKIKIKRRTENQPPTEKPSEIPAIVESIETKTENKDTDDDEDTIETESQASSVIESEDEMDKSSVESDKEDEGELKREEAPKTSKVGLLLGDIIEISSPDNHDYHQQAFYITYLDRQKMSVINIATLETYQIIFANNTDIERIVIISRSDVRGYARQNDLLVGKWIDIHFGGEIPKILTGEITDLEEDCIEITLFPELEKIYIDFEYKGLPLELPIETINIRDKPSSLANVKSIKDISVTSDIVIENATEQEITEEASITGTESGEYIISIPEKYTADLFINEQLSQEYHKGDDIIFGEELGTTTFFVEVPEAERRYGIDIQTTDLMDELLSTIPNSKRTPNVMDNIRCLIERYKELRMQFSVFNDNGYIVDRRRVTAQYKPILHKLEKWDTPIKWIVPTIKQRQKLYSVDESTLEMNSDANDYSIYSANEDIVELQTIYQQYLHNHSNENTSMNGYENCYRKFSVKFQPFDEPAKNAGVGATTIPIYQVNSPIECMINNNDDYESSFFSISAKSNETLDKIKYSFQKLGVGMTRLITENIDGAKTTRRQAFTENEKMHIQSLLIMPEPVIKFSHITLPSTDIYTKVNFHQNYVDYFRLFHKNREIKTDIVDLETSVVDFANNTTDIREFSLDEKHENEPDGFNKMMNIVFPKTRTIIKMIQREHQERTKDIGDRPYSFVDYISELEPYFIYSSDITYKQYQEIRNSLKHNKTDFAKEYVKKQGEYESIHRFMDRRNKKDRKDLFKHSMFAENTELFETFRDYYKNLSVLSDSVSISEKLQEIINIDQSVVLNDLITFLLIPLISTDNIIDLFKTSPKIDDMTGTKKENVTHCATRVLTKRYTSLHQLHEDDKTDKIYYDAEFDATPYEIAKTDDYVTKKKSLSPEKFQEYLKILLEKKYGISPDISTEVAINIIAGKKLVKNGEYCILEIVPTVSSVEEASTKKAELEMEESLKRQMKYYKRINHIWVHDSSVDKHSFIDTNTLFCNYDTKCYKPTKKPTDACETISVETRSRFMENDRKRILKEFDDRIELSVAELKEALGKNLKKHLRRLQLSYRLRDIQTIKTDIMIYELYGKRPNAYEFLSSPYAKLRDMILTQGDFAKKQQDILRFIDSFCRKAMTDELKEDANWYYCKETNVKLLPAFFYSLAYVFTTGGDYSRKQDELCREIGILSDDGSSIVDKHSGYIIRHIDFVSGYLASDTTEDADIYNQIALDITATNSPASLTVLEKTRDYEDPQTAMIFLVIKKLATDIGISVETMDIDKILGLAMRIVDSKIPREDKYKKSIEKAEKQGKKLIPYDIYKNRAILFIVSGLFFISVQTAIPNFQLKKTFPGCVRSLQGYPLTGMENTGGIEYISCILYAIKSSFAPYNGIEKLKKTEIVAQFKDAIQKYIIEGGYPDVEEMLENKRRWLLTQPEEPEIPKEHQLERMVHFQPPFVEFSVIKSLASVSKSFREDLENLMRTGNKAQRESISLIKSRLLYFGYGVIEAINKIVNTQDVVLKTMSNIPFMENACCLSSKKEMIQPIQFFIKENPQIQVYLHASSKLSAFMERIDRISKAVQIFHPESTALIYVSNRQQTTITNRNIYSAFIHYCNFDKETYPVPEYLVTICNEKPAGWNSKWTLDEKIMKLTLSKTNFNERTCRELLKIIESRNILSTIDIHKEKLQWSKVSTMIKRLELLADADDTSIIDERFRELLMGALKTYRPLDVATENNEEIKSLNKYLSKANGMMLKDISDFLYENSVKLGAKAYEKLEDFVANIMKWNLETTADGFYTIIQFIQNSVYSMCNLYPAVILNNSLFQTIPKHWGISEKHAEDLLSILGEYWKRLDGFKNDKIIMTILERAGDELRTMTEFVNAIPIFAPIYHNGKEYYSLFNKETTYLLFSYCWYSVLYEFVKYANDVDMLNTDIQEKRQQRREYRNDIIESSEIDRIPENEEDYINMRNTQIVEMEIQIGESSELRKRVCSLMIEMLRLEESNKKSLDYDYSKISYEIRRLKYEEKKRITDRMGNMDIDTRRIEMMLKKYKMGVWKEQKGLVNYDKETYDIETSESVLIDQLKNIEGATETLGEDIGTEPVDYEIEDLDRMDAEDAEDEYERELNDFTGLDEDYDDGYDPDGYGEYGADDF